ncbi:MAG: FAD-dependent oxidoreductase, partial [Burkholderiales bacterium]|nr:FAD-dependent oxidoreductase [Burkholderiales bacterium]
MRVAVIGAGIVGVTTAYELAAEGHEVTVFERRSSVAAEASFANAGVVAPGYVTPWAAPGMAWKVLKQLPRRHAAVRIGAAAALAELPWLWRWWRACRPAVHAANRIAMHRLARASRERMLELTDTLGLDYEQARGCLVLLRGERELALARPGLKLLAELGVSFELVDAERARRVEPGLNAGTALRAAIHLPADGVGNCRQFAQLLRGRAEQLGAAFRFEAPVEHITPGAAPKLTTRAGEQGFDAVVVAAGIDATHLLAPLGLKLPLAAVWGYSITAPLRHVDGLPEIGPCAALMDERYKVAISRLGSRVRVAGGAEIGGAAEGVNAAALATLYRVLDDWFPGAALSARAQQWKGAR